MGCARLASWIRLEILVSRALEIPVIPDPMTSGQQRSRAYKCRSSTPGRRLHREFSRRKPVALVTIETMLTWDFLAEQVPWAVAGQVSGWFGLEPELSGTVELCLTNSR